MLISIGGLLLAANSWATGFTPADLNGQLYCGTTFYTWSSEPDASPLKVATGVVDLAGDGAGKWSKGTLREEMLREKSGSKEICNYDLVDGHYTIKTDGGGVSNTSWKAAAGSDPRCASFDPGSFATAGVVPASKAAPPVTASVNFYLTRPNTGYQMAFGPAGFAVGTCGKPPLDAH
jgi:hypothetical protein